MLIVLARRQLIFSKAGGRRSFRQLERLVIRQPIIDGNVLWKWFIYTSSRVEQSVLQSLLSFFRAWDRIFVSSRKDLYGLKGPEAGTIEL
jgi:hypothetical protein